jgi:hypothetical protein
VLNVLLLRDSIILMCIDSSYPIQITYIHTYISLTLYQQRHLRYYSETPTFYQNYLAMSNTADVTGGKPTSTHSNIWGVNAINPLVAFYDIHGRKREVLFCYFVLDTTRDKLDQYKFVLQYPCIKSRESKHIMWSRLPISIINVLPITSKYLVKFGHWS